ncbi:MAG: SufD family Fe-S cluster assembly protein [Treponema sp.]|nr:SufD family Fe-S cluster assembly protein [Treponema sp.]
MNTELTYTNINPIPALTWNWLKINRATIDAEAPELGGSVTVSGLTDSIQHIKAFVPFATIAAEKGGSGEDANAILASFCPTPEAFIAQEGAQIAEPVILRFALENGKSHASRQAIIAEPGSSITVIMDYTSEPDAGGFHAVQTKLWAKAGAHIHLVKVNLLGSGFTQLDDTAAFCDAGASIDVTQIELGGAKTYAGVGATLSGYKSSFKSDTAYYCRDNQLLDMNYAVWHKGGSTDTDMHVKGVVADDAVKVYRGTIDFQHGCAGATGNEQEETLLLSPTAVNKSIPMILCDEEDVSGTHGATIGRLSAEELFYMQSRGISELEAKRMMSRAKIAATAHFVGDAAVTGEIDAFLDRLESQAQ